MEEETNKVLLREEEEEEGVKEQKIEGGETKEEARAEEESSEQTDEAITEEPKNAKRPSTESRYLNNDDTSEKRTKKSSTQPATRRLTRAERARQEALSSFGGQDLASVVVKKRDLRQELHRDVNLMKQGNSSAPLRPKPNNKKMNSSEGLKGALFGGGERPVTRKRKLNETSSSTTADAQPPQPQKVSRRITKAEQARLDALRSFGGCGLDDVLATSRKRIAKTFEMKEEKVEGEEGGEEREKESEEEEEETKEEEKENVTTTVVV